MFYIGKIDFPAMENFIMSKLNNELSEKLSYHSIHHVTDVYNTAQNIAKLESIDVSDTLLIKTAALYHDSGFIVNSVDHEERGCQIARESLPKFGYSDDAIDIICGMIMATKVPQTPKNKLDEIICDADLDYLGRDDYNSISERFYQEISQNGSMDDIQWLKLQIHFLEQHHFFTATSIEMRREKKEETLLSLKKDLANKILKR